MKIARHGLLVVAVILAVTCYAAKTGSEQLLTPGADGVQRATVLVDSHFYKPKDIAVRVGLPVELTLVSQTTITPHNFVLKEPEAGLMVNQEIGAGETVKVRFTPGKAGVYTFYCDKKLLFFKSHREKGMEGLLTVQ
jgi:plastocyanin